MIKVKYKEVAMSTHLFHRLRIQILLASLNVPSGKLVNQEIPQSTQGKIARSATLFLNRTITDQLKKNKALQDQGIRLMTAGHANLFSPKQAQQMQQSIEGLLKEQYEGNKRLLETKEEISHEHHRSSKHQVGQ
jgi:uncharacterized protein YneF (UPF0154 family)